MQPNYDPLKLTNDAVAFARSHFGKHYLAKLEAKKELLLGVIDSEKATPTEKDRAAARRAEIDDWLNYFKTAKAIKSDPGLIERLKAGAARRLGKQDV